MRKLWALLAMAAACCVAAAPQRVVITKKASQMERTPSFIANDLEDVPDWEMDYVVSARDAARLKGLKLHVRILDKSGHFSKKYYSTIYTEPKTQRMRIMVHPKQVKKPWGAHELGNIGSIVIVGEPGAHS